jgi:hypothetical protein
MRGGEPVFRRNPSVVARALRDELVVLHLKSGQYYGLNGVGALLWDMIDGTRTTASLVDALRAAPLIELAHDVEADVVRFLEGLRERDLIVE